MRRMMPAAVPVYRARLPRAADLVPYLERIDANAWYTNHGELVRTFEERLGRLTDASRALWVTASSGTAALEAAILATAGRATPDRPLAFVPAYTFVATAMAVERCGYTPYFVDVDPARWAIRAETIADHPLLARAGVVVPVMAYGRAMDQRPWHAFAEETGTPVVIDGAAAIEAIVRAPAVTTGPVPVAVSFHATKPLSTAEGGAVVWSDRLGCARAARALNFGFYGKRQSIAPGLNGKMSEYHAAIGLASLQAFAEREGHVARLARAYAEAFAAYDLGDALLVSPDVASSYALLRLESEHQVQHVMRALVVEAIEYRQWYGTGLHQEPAFAAYPHDTLAATETIAQEMLGIPFYPELDDETLERITRVVARTVYPRASEAP